MYVFKMPTGCLFHLQEDALKAEQLSLVVGLEVVQVLAVDQLQAVHEQLGLQQVALGLLPDLGERLLHLHRVVAVQVVDHVLGRVRGVVLARDAPQPVISNDERDQHRLSNQ